MGIRHSAIKKPREILYASEWNAYHVIDGDVDFKGYRAVNLGAPVNDNDALRKIDLDTHKTASPIDHPDESITPAKLLSFPDVTTATWASLKQNFYFLYLDEYTAFALFNTSLDDAEVDAIDIDPKGTLGARLSVGPFNPGYGYYSEENSNNVTKDHRIFKINASGLVELACDAIDIPSSAYYIHQFIAQGATLTSNLTNSPAGINSSISATDTEFTVGLFGYKITDIDNKRPYVLESAYLMPATKAKLKIRYKTGDCYFILPLTGTGEKEDMYRPLLPEQTKICPVDQRLYKKYKMLRLARFTNKQIFTIFSELNALKINVYAVSHSNIMPIEGRRINDSICVVAVFRTDGKFLLPFEERLEKIKEIKGAKRISREEAIKLALKLNDKFHELDFRRAKSEEEIKDYIDFKQSVCGWEIDEVREKIIREQLKYDRF